MDPRKKSNSLRAHYIMQYMMHNNVVNEKKLKEGGAKKVFTKIEIQGGGGKFSTFF